MSFVEGPVARFPGQWRFRAHVLFSAVLALSLSACERQTGSTPPAADGEVVVYSSIDEAIARPVADLFTRKTGIDVKLVTDTEETKSSGLLNRLIAESSRPRADVFWSGDPVRAAVLRQRDIAAAYTSPQAAGLPEQFSDPNSFFAGFAARARVIIYNRNLVAAGSEPKSIFDLADRRFTSNACIANPLFGTSSMHAAALFATLGEAKARAFFDSLTSNRIRMLSSNGEVRRRVSAGEFAVGLTDSDDVSVAIRDGQPVGFVLPDQDGLGTLLVPSAAVLIAGAPHPGNAKKFIDFLLSEEVERRMAESDAAHFPLRPGLPPPPLFQKRLDEIRVMKVDYEKLAHELERLTDGFLTQWVFEQGK